MIKKARLMKNIISSLKHMRKLVLIPAFFIALFISSCEDIIDLAPYTSVSEATAYSTPSLIELSVIGMYNGAQRGYYPANGTGRGYPFGAAFVEQGDCRGEDAVNLQAFYQLPMKVHIQLPQPTMRLTGVIHTGLSTGATWLSKVLTMQ
jgi:hypothetical protein